MNFNFIILFFYIFDEVYLMNFYSNGSTPLILHWMSSNFGSSFASQPYLHDVNQDNYLDMISVSVDGEIMVNNLKNGETLSDSNWPVYLSKDHFFAKPFVYIHGENMKKELICTVSHKGRIYFFDWNGIIVKTEQVTNVYLRRNWTFIQYKEFSEIISTEKKSEVANAYYELYPEVFADGVIMDLSVKGALNDLVVPVTFVTEELGQVNAIVAAIVVFNLAIGSMVDVRFLSVSQRDSEYPGYTLSNVDILRKEQNQLIVTLTSGVIYQLQWDQRIRQFRPLFNGQITYNQGPHNCHLTSYCADIKHRKYIDRYLCCVFVDFFGHVAMMDLSKHQPMWEYTARDAGVPTATKIFLDGQQSAYVVFANDLGWIHCVSLLTGKSREYFPIQISGDSFSASVEIISDKNDQLFLILVSDNGHIYTVPLDSPAHHRSIFHNERIASYLPPLLTHSQPTNVDLIIHSKNGFIFKLEIPNFKRKEESLVRTNLHSTNAMVISTLYGVGSSFSLTVNIIDPGAPDLTNPQFYTVQVFINQYLYHTHTEAHSGRQDTTITMSIDLSRVNGSLAQQSLFIFGTATILVTDPHGRTLPPEYINVRINYDFQYELVWVLYLTFFTCCAALLLYHSHDSNDRLSIPVYSSRDS